ncbi:efflux RND transporter periplasmic adaptor subunit [Pseudonocardia thermophila]|uniref:efflux RND transporter periplasmic adaptor subunit n=1 Tax=Pseudonocardia thermophila TaxID=1848 RepID=UPI00248E4F3A|nr:biotin/lipoyl-binding protein [Pseudonocardia thermophila]
MAGKRHLTAGLAAVAVLVTACSGDSSPVPTVRVDRGPVTTSVSASGTLVSIDEQNLGFADRGQIAEILVKVGDEVRAGDVLARLDDGALTQALKSAQAKLDQQRASLGKITGSYSIEGAQAALDAARAVLEATEANVHAINEANAAATRRAEVQLEFDRDVLRQTKKANASGCQTQDNNNARITTTDDQSSSSGSDRGRSGLLRPNSMGEPTTAAPVRPIAFSRPMDDDDDDGFDASSCPAVQNAQRQVIASETALVQARHTEETARTQGRISIENARANVVQAENTLESAKRDNSADTKVQEAVLRDAEIAVESAQRDLENATLRAPVGGVVAAINATVGEFIPAASGGTPQAPGSTARLPGAVGGTDASATSLGGGGGAFITLTNVDTFQLVVPFEESDAAQISPNQQVEVSIDAIPGLVKPGTVVAVAPSAETISGVVSYYVTIVLNETDPRLKDGQTAQADVITKSVENVLRVPSTAVRQDAALGSVVNIPGPDGEPVPPPVTTGLQGDDFTEITSGLREGQEIVLPQATVSTIDPRGPRNGG